MSLSPIAPVPPPRTPESPIPPPPHDHGHSVQFYQAEDYLFHVVADFLAAGLSAGQPALVIATPAHRSGFLDALAAKGVDIARVRRDGRMELLDARETIDACTVDGLLDESRFRARLGGAIAEAARGGGNPSVCTYGEMVDLLWKDGNDMAAIRMEELWNDLGRTFPFSLLCGYSIRDFASAAHSERFREICRLHGHVLPTERYQEGDDATRLMRISLLEQRAEALETEVANRRELEQRLREALGEHQMLLERARRACVEAEEANRAKRDFLAMMSHELRTPLNGIAGYAELLEIGVYGPVNDEQLTAVQRIQQGQRRLLALVEEVLIYARTEAKRIEYRRASVPLDEVIRSAHACIAPQLEAKQLGYEASLPAPPPVARADPERAQQVLLNLLSNAIKFTPSGGRIRVECEADDLEVRVRVIDSGIGIPEEKLEAVFQPFVQVETDLTREFEGVGLGLAISREFALGMGGNLSVVSIVGEGAAFTLTLPRMPPPEGAVG